MKKISAYIPALLLGAAALGACSDNWEQPPVEVPTIPADVKANITLAELKTLYWQDTETYGTMIGLGEDGDSLIVVGTVVSNGSSGNIYKTVVVQDETAAVTIGVDDSSVGDVYMQGMKVAINVTGMAIGRYNGLVQLGELQTSGVNRMSLEEFNAHTQRGFFGGVMDTTLVTIPEMDEASRTTEGKIEWQSRLVRINNIKFVEAGEDFTTGSTTSRYIIDDEGNRMIVYNSSYADFAYDQLPYGHGDIVGILSCYRNSWQLLLNDLGGLIDFDGEGAPDPNSYVALNEPFSANSQGDFTIENITLGEGLSYVWYTSTSYGMCASGFANGTCIESDAWLISPEVDLTDAHDGTLQFSHCVNKFTGDGYLTQATVAIREVGAQTQWEEVEIPNYSTNADWTFVESGDIDLSAYSGKKIQIGFHYTSSAASAGTWEVKNVVVRAIKNEQ